jgi:hypothetical protein
MKYFIKPFESTKINENTFKETGKLMPFKEFVKLAFRDPGVILIMSIISFVSLIFGIIIVIKYVGL